VIEFVTLSDRSGSVEVCHAPGVITGGSVALVANPRFNVSAEVTLTPDECRELADALTRAAEEAERA
jgi:hypothetical protein